MEGLFDVDFLATLHVDALHGVGYAATAEVVDGSVGVVEGLGGYDASGCTAKFEAEAVGGFTCHSVSGEEGAVLLERGAAGVVESYAIGSVAEYEEGGLFFFGAWEACGRTAEDVVREVAGGCAGNEEQEVILFGVAHEDNALFGCDVFHLHGLGNTAFGVGHLVGFHVKSGVEGEVVGQEGGGIGVGAYGIEVYNEFFDGHEVPLGCGGRFAVFPAHDFAIGRLIVQVVVGVVRAVHVAEGEEAAIVRNFEETVAVAEEAPVAEETVESLINAKEDAELISIYYGDEVTEDEANALAEKIGESHPDVDVEVNCGGQPVYYYILSVE